MISFTVDEKQKTLRIKIVGKTTPEEIKKAATKTMSLSQNLGENFAVITDLSMYKQSQKDDLDILSKIHLLITKQFKVGNVIRVVGNSKDLLLSLSANDKKYSIENIKYVSNLKAALARVNTDY
jgi:hypothetical protein